MTNREMIDYAKDKMIRIIEECTVNVGAEAAKALALLIIAESNKQIVSTLTPKYNSTMNELDRYECPMCGKEVTGCNYCPNCGAKFI